MRSRTAAAAVLAVVLAACGGDDTSAGEGGGTTASSGAGAGQAGGGDGSGDGFCADLEAFVTTNVGLVTAALAEDQAALDAAVADLPAHAEAVEASAPPDLAADVAVMAGAADAVTAVGSSDLEAVGTAYMGATMTDEATAAADRLSEYARTECGFDPDAIAEGGDAGSGGNEGAGGSLLGEAPEPPDPCTAFDAQPAADAAGVTVDVADRDGGSDVNLGAWATKSCSYGNGTMTISTITFSGDVDQIREDFIGTAESNGGEVLDVGLGGLPDSTLVTSVNGFPSIHVFEAGTPFGVAFAGTDDPAILVAAAEALLPQAG